MLCPAILRSVLQNGRCRSATFPGEIVAQLEYWRATENWVGAMEGLEPHFVVRVPKERPDHPLWEIPERPPLVAQCLPLFWPTPWFFAPPLPWDLRLRRVSAHLPVTIPLDSPKRFCSNSSPGTRRLPSMLFPKRRFPSMLFPTRRMLFLTCCLYIWRVAGSMEVKIRSNVRNFWNWIICTTVRHFKARFVVEVWGSKTVGGWSGRESWTERNDVEIFYNWSVWTWK